MMSATTELPGHYVNSRGFLKADRRTKQRNPIFKFGVITCDPDRRMLSVVKNISATGAMIEVDNALEIPDEFTLAIESEPSARVCHVVWRNAKQIAVNFDDTPREVRPDPVEQPQNERQERRLSPRRGLNAAGWLRLDGSFGMRECRIVDVSATGVRLATPFAGKLPETFTVLFEKHGQGHRIRMIWRRANQIGAKFI
jgi:PilZ domain